MEVTHLRPSLEILIDKVSPPHQRAGERIEGYKIHLYKDKTTKDVTPPTTKLQTPPKMPYLSIPSGCIFYKDTPASDPSSSEATLILHHGLGSTHNYHQIIVPPLTASPHNFRCIAYDAISCGLSDLGKGAQSIETVAQDVIDVLDALKVDKAVFVGHSFAGIVAAHLAATRGDRIQAAVMLGPVLPSGDVAKVFDARIKTVEDGKVSYGPFYPLISSRLI